MLAAIMRQSSGGGSGSSSSSTGGGGTKLSIGIPRFSGTSLGSSSPARISKSSLAITDSPESPTSDPHYIMQLVSDVRKFADVLLQLKEVFNSKEHQDCLHHAVHERLGELLRVLKAIISKHQSLNSVDILSTAGTVITTVKGVNFKEVNEENKQELFKEIYNAIDTLAFTFGNVVSDFLMGDVENGSVLGLPLTKRSRSFENLVVESGGSGPEKDDPPGPCPPVRVEDVDNTLQQRDTGVESALLYAKAWSKYTKELLAWVEKRLNVDIECAKSYAKMAESAKTLASQQEFMPFREIYMTAFKNDMEYSQLVLQTAAVLQSNKFMQPLMSRKNELDKLRKEVKDQWQREQKKMHEADNALRKARLLQVQRQEEYEKAKISTSRLEEEQVGGGAAVAKQLEKRRRLEEEALQKAEEAREHCKACLIDVGEKRVDLAKTKSVIVTQIREMVSQCDLTLKAVTVNWFQLQQAQVVSLPVNHQSLCENAKLYEPGQCYVDSVRNLPAESLSFDSPVTPIIGLPFNKRSLGGCNSSNSNASSDLLGADDVDGAQHTKIAERRSNSSTDIQALRVQAPFRPWTSANQGGGMCSDSESAGGSSESRSMDSPTASPGDFKRRLPRTPSTGTMSSADDLDERELPSPSDNGLSDIVIETASSPGPFRNTQMSKASQTHKLRKLRAPSKCRECDGLVVFHGAECEECSLACHKKCLETLAIQCGHKKLQGRLHLFGIDFTQAAKNSQDGIPFIIRKCTSEIENRALNIKGIYRVNGAKSRVEKLCQAFENGKDLVELSDLYPHDISNVLKLYLRQLPEPLILFRFYNDFIGLAKECQSIIVEELEALRLNPSPVTPAQVSVELNRVLFKIKDLLRQLPPAHYRTLQFLIEHLHRVTERSEENKMTASNLGIIFGPTLIKPRQGDAEVSLSSLVDYPYQALTVELLIRHYQMVFDTPLSPLSAHSPTEVDSHTRSETCFTYQEKEQLSRHSKSLGDIKEASKVYKRHSSVIPSSHILAEVEETTPSFRGSDFEPANEEDSMVLNGVLSSDGPKPGERGLCRSQHITITSVQLRHPRNKMYSRPVSLPAERIHGRGKVDENNTWNNADQGFRKGSSFDESIQEVDETENAKLHVATHHRRTFIDTQTLRRTWDKQYKHDVASRTVRIMASSPTESTAVDVPTNLSTSVPSGFSLGTSVDSISTVYPNRPYTVAVRPSRTLRREDNVTKFGTVSTAFRAPRTLQPPPGTFYKPPSGSKAKALQSCASANSAEEEDEEEEDDDEEEGEELTIDLEVSVDEPLEVDIEAEQEASSQSSSSSPEQMGQNQAKPVYQRLRSRHLQEVEHREAHFV
ncbi:rho GTPase-activating protein 29-like isoform X1 [Solea senegalensis]|uniref:Rho GTPase-activating protein 29 n=2 Tax=Solea senegalensis TaxID=28829 RepID=A0AAV6T373_SOLSE|nr:rho GTPase-activating protein 29 isoform X1 [Solea senegalensis]KAG7523790.1 rho GTPase-activating protein 29-like isoform X1 [Solea senegalensis]